jgi:hypothetical protein
MRNEDTSLTVMVILEYINKIRSLLKKFVLRNQRSRGFSIGTIHFWNVYLWECTIGIHKCTVLYVHKQWEGPRIHMCIWGPERHMHCLRLRPVCPSSLIWAWRLKSSLFEASFLNWTWGLGGICSVKAGKYVLKRGHKGRGGREELNIHKHENICFRFMHFLFSIKGTVRPD